MAHSVLPLLLAALCTSAIVSAFEPTITPRLIDEAVILGQNRVEATRLRYHRPYRLEVTRAPIDYIDVVTPFRRVVMLAEERMQGGSRGFTQRDAIAALGDRAGVIELRVELTFHPLNTFVGVPAYEVELVSISAPAVRVMPSEMARIPRFGARLETGVLPAPPGGLPNPPGVSQPLTGGTIAADFPMAMLNGSAVYEVVVSEKGKDLARTRVNFGMLQ